MMGLKHLLHMTVNYRVNDINLAPNEKFYKLFEGVESIIAEHIEILEEDE